MTDASVAQAQSFVDGKWIEKVAATPEPLTYQQYIFTGTTPSLRDPEADEIVCSVCSSAGKEQVLADRVRVWHPGRIIPCRAPEGCEPVQRPEGRLL